LATSPVNLSPIGRPYAQSLWTQFRLLLSLQYSEYRANAVVFVAFGMVMPLGIFWILDQYVGVGPQAVWLLAGNMVLSVCYGSVNFALQRVGFMKMQGEMDYYATLPVGKGVFVAAIFVLGLLSALPGLLTSMLIGKWMLHLPFARMLWALPLALLAAASLTVIGAAIGALGRTMGHITLSSSMMYVVVTFLCPVMLPVEKMPLPLAITAYVLPPGQAAIALTQALTGTFGVRFWVLTGLLCVWLLLASVFGVAKLEWRSN
jgi:ABC-2 type transport system permease protein